MQEEVMSNREKNYGSGQSGGKNAVGKAKTAQEVQSSLASSLHEE